MMVSSDPEISKERENPFSFSTLYGFSEVENGDNGKLDINVKKEFIRSHGIFISKEH